MTRRPLRPSPVSQAICRIVQARPGIHFRDLGRAAGLPSAGQLRHHLDRLRRQGLVLEFADGRYRRYFALQGHDARLRGPICRFARPIPQRIGRALLAGPLNRTALRRTLDLADSTLGYHLARMVAAGDLARTKGVNCCNYSLVDADLVREVVHLQATALDPADARVRSDALPASPPAPRAGDAPAALDAPAVRAAGDAATSPAFAAEAALVPLAAGHVAVSDVLRAAAVPCAAAAAECC